MFRPKQVNWFLIINDLVHFVRLLYVQIGGFLSSIGRESNKKDKRTDSKTQNGQGNEKCRQVLSLIPLRHFVFLIPRLTRWHQWSLRGFRALG